MSAAAFQATFSDFKLVKTRQVAQFVLEVPLEQAGAALTAIGGLPVGGEEKWVAVALLKPGVKPTTSDKPSPAQEAYQAKDEGEKAVTRAVMMAKDPSFQHYALARLHNRPVSDTGLHRDPKINEDNAVQFIRSRCHITTRAEIKNDPAVLKAFLDLEEEYRSYQRYGESPN